MKKRKTSLRRKIASQTNPLTTGRRSPRFMEFCARHDLDMKDIELKSSGKLSIDVMNAVKLLETRNQKIQVLLDYYKSTGARGLRLLDQLITLNARLAEIEVEYEKRGWNILEWKEYPKYIHLQIKLTQFLEGIRWDKEKFEQENKMKTLVKGGKRGDDLFVIDTDFVKEE